MEQLAAGRKARGRIRHEEDDDDDRAQSVQQVALVMEAKRQELRYRDGVEVGRIAAEPPGHDEPVEPGTQRKADGRPARRGNACQIGQTRHTHQQPAGHIAGLGTHGRDQRPHLPAAEVEVGAVVVGLAVGKTHQKHGRKIDDDGDEQDEVGVLVGDVAELVSECSLDLLRRHAQQSFGDADGFAAGGKGVGGLIIVHE